MGWGNSNATHPHKEQKKLNWNDSLLQQLQRKSPPEPFSATTATATQPPHQLQQPTKTAKQKINRHKKQDIKPDRAKTTQPQQGWKNRIPTFLLPAKVGTMRT